MTTCTLCKKRDAIFGRRYSGENLCSRCFCKTIEDKVRRTISKYEIEKIFPDVTIYAGTIDEGIKHYRDEALKIAKRNCKKVGVEQKVVSFKKMFDFELDEIVRLIRKKRTNGLTPCSYCGVLRRKALNNITTGFFIKFQF